MAHALYTQAVIDHQRSPRNFGALESHTHAADGANPLCGDSLRIELSMTQGSIDALRFRGEACAIAIATASMLSELAIGKSMADIDRIDAAFARVVAGESAHEAILSELNAMSALAAHPVRRKCALLPFATLRAAMAGESHVTTEGKEP